jgi:hypothetical protein
MSKKLRNTLKFQLINYTEITSSNACLEIFVKAFFLDHIHRVQVEEPAVVYIVQWETFLLLLFHYFTSALFWFRHIQARFVLARLKKSA